MKKYLIFVLFSFLVMACFYSRTENISKSQTITITDHQNREIAIPRKVENIICSGPGALRYICYLDCIASVVGVDDIEKRENIKDARPYCYANPGLKEMPLFGEFRGQDNPELILTLNPVPDLIFKIKSETGYNPLELQNKTNIPVVVFDYGDLSQNRKVFYNSLKLIAKVMDRKDRAMEIIEYIENLISDLDKRTSGMKANINCYVGGVAYKGPLGLQSTEPGYPPFAFLNTKNVSFTSSQAELVHMDVSKEKILDWDPDIIFIDLATFQNESQGNALYELANDPSYKTLKAYKTGEIYGVLPYNWYTQNHGNTLANAYFIGKILYPQQFLDINPQQKADEIYSFLFGKKVFQQLNQAFDNLVYTKLGI